MPSLKNRPWNVFENAFPPSRFAWEKCDTGAVDKEETKI